MQELTRGDMRAHGREDVEEQPAWRADQHQMEIERALLARNSLLLLRAITPVTRDYRRSKPELRRRLATQLTTSWAQECERAAPSSLPGQWPLQRLQNQ
jgi:hypothetical protein